PCIEDDRHIDIGGTACFPVRAAVHVVEFGGASKRRKITSCRFIDLEGIKVDRGPLVIQIETKLSISDSALDHQWNAREQQRVIVLKGIVRIEDRTVHTPEIG